MKNYNGEKAVISLTSWKKRIKYVGKTIFNLIKVCPGFHIVLVLSEDEFPKKEDEFPDDLKAIIDNNLIEVLWIKKNYKSFKKVQFTAVKYNNVPVISADDDCIYKCNYAQKLYDKWTNNKKCIITNDGVHKSYLDWVRGPNTLYPIGFFKDPEALCSKYFSSNLNFIDEDMTYGILAKNKGVKIIDLNEKEFYYFHDEDNAQSASNKTRNLRDRFEILNRLFSKCSSF